VANAPAITRPTPTDIDMCIYTLSFEQYEPFGRSCCCCFTLSDSENNLLSVILFTANENSTITQRRFHNAPSASRKIVNSRGSRMNRKPSQIGLLCTIPTLIIEPICAFSAESCLLTSRVNLDDRSLEVIQRCVL
jgi:hypothetical protein